MVAVAATADRVYLAAPSGAVGAIRYRPRAGPLFRRLIANVPLVRDDGEDPLDDAGASVSVPVDIIEADLRALASCTVSDDIAFNANYPGSWPSGPDLADFIMEAVPGLGLDADADDLEEEALPEGPAPPLAAPATANELRPEFLAHLLRLQESFLNPGAIPPPGPPHPQVLAPPPGPPVPIHGGAAGIATGAPPGLPGRPKHPGPAAGAPMHALDPAVVASARAAGISDSDLRAFDTAVGAGVRRLSEPAPGRTAPAAADGPGDPGDPAPEGDRLDRLVDALTAALTQAGASSTAVPADPVERALASLDGGTRTGEPVGSRRGASARLALRRALADNPEHFTRYVESQLASAFASRSVTGAAPTMREYVELRSRIGNHRPTISWAWSVAGARDALAAGRTAEALARLDLALIAGEQTSIDGGSWLLAQPQELLWEEDPPFGAFAARRPAEPGRAATSHLCDPRWAEAALSRLKELDDWNERRRRLGGPPPPHRGMAEDQGFGGATGGGDGGGAPLVKPKGAPRRPPKGAPAAPPGA